MATKFGTASKANQKTKIYCQDGPMCGHYLWLTGVLQSQKTTAIFTYRGQAGRYVGGKWHSVG